jgi:hypothetical protein
MDIVIVIGTLAVFGFSAWIGCQILFDSGLEVRLRVAYAAVLIAAGVVAALTTFGYEYYSNANTRIRGWPVPMIILQRDSAEAPWLDFVGPTTLLGYPMNFAIFMVAPSVVFLGFLLWHKRIGFKRKAESGAAPDQQVS